MTIHNQCKDSNQFLLILTVCKKRGGRDLLVGSLFFWIIFSKTPPFFKNQIIFMPCTFEPRSQEIYRTLHWLYGFRVLDWEIHLYDTSFTNVRLGLISSSITKMSCQGKQWKVSCYIFIWPSTSYENSPTADAGCLTGDWHEETLVGCKGGGGFKHLPTMVKINYSTK